MAYRVKRNLNEELARINEIIVDSQPQLLTEVKGDPIKKAVGDAVEGLFTPEGMKKLFKKLNLEDLSSVTTKFVDNFDDFRALAKDNRTWNDMISNAKVLESVTDVFDTKTGKLLTPEELDTVYKTDLESLLDGSKYRSNTKFFQKTEKGWDEISIETYEELKKQGGKYYDLPPYLRYSAAEILSALDNAQGGIKTIDDLLVALRGFLRGTATMTPDLRRAIISLMSNTPGFAAAIKDALKANNRFYKFTKIYQNAGKMDVLHEAIADVLGLKKGAKILDDLQVLMSDMGVLFERWFDFVLQSWRPFKALGDLRYGTTTSRFRTFVSDIVMGGFFDYIMGAQVLKSMYSSIEGVVKSKTPLKKIGTMLLIGWMIIGGYKSVRDWKIPTTLNPVEWFKAQIAKFGQYCAGDNKVKDALTGDLYANVIGDKSNAEGTRTTCGPIEFNTAFLETYTASNDNPHFKPADVKTIATSLYNALNVDSPGDNPMTIFKKKGKKIPFTDIDVQIPTVTKLLKEYFGAFWADASVVQEVVDRPGMDILKMSQISDYYETNFDASLLEDMQTLDYWRQVVGGWDFEAAETAIMKLPYLDPTQGDLNFDTWLELTEENEKMFLTYPDRIAFEIEVDGDMMMQQIKLAKCGPNCNDADNNKCNCNDGGCNLGGQIVDVATGIALENNGYKTQEQLNALCKLETGFDTLEEIFNGANNKSGTGCILRRGR